MRAETPKVDKAVSTEDEDSLTGQPKLPKDGISDIERLEVSNLYSFGEILYLYF